MAETVKVAYESDGELGPIKITGRDALPAKLAAGFVEVDNDGNKVESPGDDAGDSDTSDQEPSTPSSKTKRRSETPAAEDQE